MAEQPQTEAPEGLETKNAALVGGGRDSVIDYRVSPVPHGDRTGSQLTDDERGAVERGQSGSVVHSDGSAIGVTTESGGTQPKPAVGRTARK